ncbi:MAG: ribbon-helix-helix domain-containing protein [Hyphomicrobium aestuarii]|nr:ribbon-helix-helix domain-containing protein [Hyphomicrobium aestuarii]
MSAIRETTNLPGLATSREPASTIELAAIDNAIPKDNAGPFAITLPESAGRPVKRSFSIRGHRTSISLETPFWDALVALAADRAMPVAGVVAAIDAVRGKSGLSSAIRIVVLEHYRSASRDRSQG